MGTTAPATTRVRGRVGDRQGPEDQHAHANYAVTALDQMERRRQRETQTDNTELAVLGIACIASSMD
jgi:hypothetical protein